MSNRVKVLFFATLREKTGTRETELDLEQGAIVSEVKSMLLERYPALKQSMDTLIVAMNHEFAFDENPVPEGAEIALFPPVSGGSTQSENFPTVISLVDREININSIVEKITLDTTGAACVFTGIVRGVTTRGTPHVTNELEYEAYKLMAITKLDQISSEIRSRWSEVEGIAIVQRVGKLTPGMVTVVIACTSSHRDSGIFEAARYGIDRVKEIVPIWKKEISPDGEEWVEGEYIPAPGE